VLPIEATPVVIEPKAKLRDKHDETMVMSPPPAPAVPGVTVSAAAQLPQAPGARPSPAKRGATGQVRAEPAKREPVKPEPTRPEPIKPDHRRAKADSVNSAFDSMILPAESKNGKSHGVSTASDLAEVRRVFEDVAAVHVGQVRDVMLELSYGEADPAWMDATRPALRSLRAMAQQMELTDLCQALDDFCSTVETTLANRAKIGDDGKTELLRRYQRLIELIPQAFELDAERDRREPIIVEALLYQVEGVEKPTIEKLFAVGLGKLEALLAANADDVAAVSGIRKEIAVAIVAQFKTYRATANSAVSAPDAVAERKQLGDLLIVLSLQNDDFRRAADGWTVEDKTKKRELRKAREQTFQRIKVTLARLGEREQLTRLEKLPFDERIAQLDMYLSTPLAGART
jgi:hypothetical protein